MAMSNPRPFPYRIVFLTGVDGSGKTFFARQLIDALTSRGFRVIHVWSRFNNYLSKPLLAIARGMGLNYYETRDGVKIGYHDFEKNPIIAFLFVWLQLFDVWIASVAKFWTPLIFKDHVLIVSDRGPHDTLMDVVLDTGKEDLPYTFLGKLYCRAIPFRHKILFINRKREKIESSRPDIKVDRKFPRRLNLYLRHQENLGFCAISNDGNPDQTLSQIMVELFNETEKDPQLGV